MTNALGDLGNFTNTSALINQTQIKLLKKLSKPVPSIQNQEIQNKISEVDLLYKEAIQECIKNTLEQITAIHGLIHLYNWTNTPFSIEHRSKITLLELELKRLGKVGKAYLNQIRNYEDCINYLKQSQ